MVTVVSRTFYRIIFCSLILGSVGVLLDVDHWYALQVGWDPRWFHYTLASSPVVYLLLSLICGAVILAFALRWDIVK